MDFYHSSETESKTKAPRGSISWWRSFLVDGKSEKGDLYIFTLEKVEEQGNPNTTEIFVLKDFSSFFKGRVSMTLVLLQGHPSLNEIPLRTQDLNTVNVFQ